MTQPTVAPAPTPETPDTRTAALLAAGEAVLAHLHPRAPLRLARATLGGVTYGLAPDPAALIAHRGLREDVALVALAGAAMARLLGVPAPAAGRDPRALLDAALTEPEEREALDALLTVLEARARAALRRSWAEIEVVAAGLAEHGALDAQEIAHRIRCAQGIRGTLLN